MEFTLANIRTKLYDETANNMLLEGEEYIDATITNAMDQALSYWNSTSPLISSLEYDASTDVPENYSEMFMKGVIGILLTDRVPFLSRNRDSSPGEPQDSSYETRVQEYKQIGDQYIKVFYEWVYRTKRALASKALRTGS